jgi:malonate-semialdehyde dehydrogenase (acetylating)/methylmalonate-semialdehyde dehydrogenase
MTIGVHARVATTTVRNHVGGRWVEPAGGETLDVRNPATGDVIATCPLADAATVDETVRAAAAAYPSWRAVPPQERARYFFRLRDLLEANRDELARLITIDMGKTLEDSRGEVQRGIENIETACGIPSLLMGYGLEDGAARGIDETVVYQPMGVFAGITPFNFPFMIALWFWPYAVACGNTFVLKPSEQDPLVQQRVFELIEAAGFPPGVVNLVNGGREAVNALLDHPDVRGISFVGSTPVAEHVYTRGSAAGKRVQANGGAKNALVVMPDADLDACLPNLMGSCFGAAGQRCLAGSIVVPVGEETHARVRARLLEAAQGLVVGDGLDPRTGMGPVVSGAARDRIVAAIQQGVDEGAELLLDGRAVTTQQSSPGYFVGPTVFDHVTEEMSLAQAEIFGPVIAIIPAATLEAAIELVNRSPFGNAASIYTSSGQAARQFQAAVETGNVGINVGVAAPIAYFPFSGAKRSFFGVLHGQGREAVRFFTQSKVVISRWTA